MKRPERWQLEALLQQLAEHPLVVLLGSVAAFLFVNGLFVMLLIKWAEWGVPLHDPDNLAAGFQVLVF